jgi:predicted nucleic acid-binding Zn ribbon protein
MQRFSDPPLTECGECHGQLRKLISMSTFHLKGSGWYTTDYAGKNQSTAKPAECKPSAAETKTESSSEKHS